MKRFLSTVLALVMVATTFTMLVTNVSATEAATTGEATMPKILYEENFNDLNGKTPAEILAGANMTDENPAAGDPSEIRVIGGALNFGRETAQENTYMILKNNTKLANGFIVEYDIEFLGYERTDRTDQGVYFITGEGKTTSDKVGWVSQMRYNTNVLSSVVDNGGWVSPVHPTPSSLSDYKDNDGDGAKDMLKQRTSVRVVFDPANKTIKTFAQPYATTLAAWDEATMATVWTTTGDYSSFFGNDLRLKIDAGVQVAIDNLKVTSLDGKTSIYSHHFNDIPAIMNSDGVLNALGWTSYQRPQRTAYLPIYCTGGRLIVGDTTASRATTSQQQELVLLSNNEEAKKGFVVEYDFEVPYGTAKNEGFGFHSAAASGNEGMQRRYGWVSQFRWGGSVLSGAYNGSNWIATNCNRTYNNSRIQSLTKAGDVVAIAGYRFAVRAVFDPTTGHVTTYAQIYTGQPLTWDETHAVQKSQDLSAYTDMLDGTVRLVVYSTIVLRIDNIRITTLTPQDMEVIYSNDFESIDGALALTGNGTAEVISNAITGADNKALHVADAVEGTLFSSWRLMEGFQMEFDLNMVKYIAGNNSFHIYGGSDIRNTWNFAINNAKVLNTLKAYNKWQYASESMQKELTEEKWYRFRLTVDPIDGVTVERKDAAGTGSFEVIDQYSSNRKSQMVNAKDFWAGVIRVCSFAGGEVYLDNIQISAPKKAESLVYGSDFEYNFGNGVMTSNDRGAVALKTGMYFQSVTNTAVSVDNVQSVNVNNHALRLKSDEATRGSLSALLVEEEALMDGFEMYVDINLVSSADSNALHIAGHHSNVHSTWNVVYRGGTEKRFLNGLKYTDNGANWVTHYTPASYNYGTWYTLHIVMDPTEGVTLRAKATNGGQWSDAITYSANALSNLSKSTNYLAGIIGIHLNDTNLTDTDTSAYTDVYLDNISVYTNKKQVVVYENDFNDADLATKTDAALMQALDWRYTDNAPGWHSSYGEGLLSIDPTESAVKMRGTVNPSGFCFQIKAKELTNGYTVSFRVKQLSTTTKSDIGPTFGGGDLGGTASLCWLLQLRNNGGVINGGGGSGNWYGADVANVDVAVNGDKASNVLGRANDQWFTVTLHVSNEDGNRVSIRRDSDGVYTYRDRQDATERAKYPETYNEYFRIVGYNSTDFMIDDFKIVVYEDAVDTKTTAIYENNFDVADTTDQDAILSSNGWTLLESNKVSSAANAAARDSISIQDGRLVVNNAVDGASGQTSFIMFNDNRLPFAEDIVVEYDFEYLDVLSGKSAEAFGFWTGAVTGRDGLVMQARPDGTVLAAANYGGWHDLKHHSTSMMTPKATVKCGDKLVTTGSRFSVRIEFNDKAMYVYIKDYNLDRDWDVCRDLAAVSHFSDTTQGKMLLDQYLRFVCYNGLSVAIDNVKVTAENVSAKFYGYQYVSSATEGAMDLRFVGLINAEMRQNASAVGYKITMTKADGQTGTKEISCNYVYSKINPWSGEPTTPTELVNCASNIYALHVTGVNAAVDIEVTPFYVVKGGINKVYGSTSSFYFDPANPPTVE